jgi:hypothetical protein
VSAQRSPELIHQWQLTLSLVYLYGIAGCVWNLHYIYEAFI